MILPNFAKNYMKLREFWAVRGGPPLKSATVLVCNLSLKKRSNCLQSVHSWSKLTVRADHDSCVFRRGSKSQIDHTPSLVEGVTTSTSSEFVYEYSYSLRNHSPIKVT